MQGNCCSAPSEGYNRQALWRILFHWKEGCVLSRSEGTGAFGGKKIRCFLAHDHVLLRQGLRRLLDDEPDLEVVGEAGNISEALAMIVQRLPDIVITDSGSFGTMVEQWIVCEAPQSRIVFLTTPETADARAEEKAGASRPATDQTSLHELLDMIRRGYPAGNAVVREMPIRSSKEWQIEETLPRKRALTAREREVLRLLAEGRTVRSVAKMLGLSIKTVDAHKFNLMRKLGIHNKTELVMWAIQKRIVKLPANF
jgi:two-component system, NarL family, response regulator NreC